MDNETAGKLAELATLVNETLSEWREWESAAQSVISVLDDVGGAIDAEDIPGAIEDALSNVRTLDWSMPKRMDELTETDMVRIENLLDEIHSDLENEETLPGDDGEMPWVVGINVPVPMRLRYFASHDEAAEFISTLEDHEAGIYFLDGPDH